MTSLKDDLKAAFWSPTPVIAWVLISALIAYSGPFGTYSGYPLLQRTLYWSVVVAISIIGGVITRVIVQRRLRGHSYWISALLTSALMALVLAGPLTVFTAFMVSDTDQHIPGFAQMMFFVFIVAVGISAFRTLLSPVPEAGQEDQSPPADDDGEMPRLLARVDAALRGDVIRLAVYDHYVSLVTPAGEAKLLMRFSDAIAELEGVDGLQVHRSHWVAVPAVVGADCTGGRVFLKMADGAQVPVSRNFRPDVEARGLLERAPTS